MPHLLVAAKAAQCCPMSTRGQLGPGLHDIIFESYKWELVSQYPLFSGASAGSPRDCRTLAAGAGAGANKSVLNSLPGLV